MQEIIYERPKLYKKQEEALFNSKRWALVEATTKAGKTVGCIAWQLEEALINSPTGSHHLWVAPIAPQSAIAYQRLKRDLPAGTFSAKETPVPRIDIYGRTIWCKSGDNPDSIYGEDYHSAVIDEASRTKPELWAAVRSTLTATQGRARIIGNVKGKKNWFYEWSRRAEKGEDPNAHYARLTVLDALAAGIIPQSEIDDARLNLPEHIFNELYMAIPSEDQGNPFGEDYIYSCVRKQLAPGPVVAWGIDLAKKHDYLVIVGLNQTGAVAQFHRWHGLSWEDAIPKIQSIVGSDIPTLADSTGLGDRVVEELAKGHPNIKGFTFSTQSKQKIMEGLAVSIQRGQTTFPDGPIKEELLNFEYKTMPSGRVVYQAAEGYKDDCVCALALARQVWSTNQPGANLLAYLELTYKPQILGEKESSIDSFDFSNSNELNDIYNETINKFKTPDRVCFRCKKVVDTDRVSDGVNIWHKWCV